MDAWTASPLAGIALSLGTYLIGTALYRKWPRPFLHPLLTSALMVILILEVTPWTMEAYQQGGDFITMLLAPATILLALPLFRQRRLLKAHGVIILLSILAGSITAVASVLILSPLLGLPQELLVSFIPKSVTTPIAVEISRQMGGIPALTAMAVVFTGIIGAVTAPTILKICRIEAPLAQGLAMGTAAHALGTSRALEMGEEQGAMSGLAIGIAGLITVAVTLILPLFGLLSP